MGLSYITLDFHIEFDSNVIWDIEPNFIIRSVFGKELRELSCKYSKEVKCINCINQKECIYCKIFEPHIEQGIVSHPVIPSSTIKDDILIVTMVILGGFSEYIDHIYLALKKAGENGILKERYKFKISNIFNNGISLLNNRGLSHDKLITELWDIHIINRKFKKLVSIDFKTPCRLKITGKYSDNPSINQILLAASRRLNILSKLYGDGSSIKYDNLNDDYTILDNTLTWVDKSYYSGRQNKSLKLGGFQGKLIVNGYFSDNDLNLLKGIEIFNLGKNTSFGLGQIELNIKDVL